MTAILLLRITLQGVSLQIYSIFPLFRVTALQQIDRS
jgi:hypothetical protein